MSEASRSPRESARLLELGSEVASSLEEARLENDAGARVREKLLAREVPRLRSTWRRNDSSRLGGLRNARFALVATLSLAATVALTAYFAWPRRDHPITVSTQGKGPGLSFVVGEGKAEEHGIPGGFIAAPALAPVPVTFSDGSSLRLAPAARVRVSEVRSDGAHVLVESGSVRVSVVHREATHWTVEAGPFEVRVTGTKFDVVYDPASSGLTVKMEEGSVFVRGCGLLGEDGHRLGAGEKLTISCRDKTMSVSAADSPAAPASAVTALPDAPSAVTVAAHARPAPSNAPAASAAAPMNASRNVMDLVRQGSHAEALIAAEANGFGSTCDGLAGPELLLLADAARYANRFDRAVEALETTRRRFPGSDAAATAAFELGRIAMDIQHELGPAGDYFETYLRERPSGSFAREAMGRAIEARSRAGDSARAERLAVRYLATWPDGPHAKLARKLSAADQDRP